MRIAQSMLPKAVAAVLIAALVVYSATRRDGEAVRSQAAANGAAAAEKPMRVLPASAAAAEWLAVLLPVDRVVALPEQMEEYSAMASTFLSDAWEDTPRFPRFTSESVLAFAPDLVLVSPFTDVSMVARVRDGGAEVMTLAEPTTWDEMERACTELGAALGESDAADDLLATLRARRDELATRLTPAGRRPLRVLPYGNYGSGGMTSGSRTTHDLALRLAGYVNVAAEAGLVGSVDLTNEVALSLRFDALLVSGSAEESRSASALRGDRTLQEIEAVRLERLIYLPTGLHVAGSHAILDTAEEIARQGQTLKIQ